MIYSDDLMEKIMDNYEEKEVELPKICLFEKVETPPFKPVTDKIEINK